MGGVSSTPFYDAIARLSEQSEGRFHMPGHKGNPAALPPFAGMLRWDITEVDGADNLMQPAGPLAESQRNMARLYGSGATLYSAAGSTACIEAMLTLFVPLGGSVVMGRNCHLAAVRALAFLDARPAWVLPRSGRVEPEALRAALAASGAAAAYVTSPDYYGRCSDIPALAAVCREAGAALLVDNAHGAHLAFLPGAPHPIRQGADACCDSAHKTLPCLTPAALLHLRDGALAEAGRAALNLYHTTSPSYPVLLSLDLAVPRLQNGPGFAEAGERLAVATAVPQGLAQPVDDPLKACLWPAAAGLEYDVVASALAGQGLTPELCDGNRIVLMASPWNRETDFARLQAALSALRPGPVARPLPNPEPPLALPRALLTPRQAVYAKSEYLPAAACVGRIAAQLATPCPPGIPVVVPGERVEEAAAHALAQGGISSLFVVK